MIYYSDLYNNLSRTYKKGMEYQVLNELSDTNPKRSDSSCLKYTRFLFEFDECKLENQKKIMEMNEGLLVRAVFSGSKSIHMIVQFEDKYSDICKRWYKKIWKWLEKNYFPGADAKCTNPSRLTRAPDVLRHDTGRIQKTLYSNPTNYISNDKDLLSKLSMAQRDWIREEKEEEESRERYRIKSKFLEKRDHNGMCREYKNVKRYLTTPFTKIRGNGNSATWFYAALCTCIQFNDNQTLEEVKEKARRERWSQHEIDHTEANARHAVRTKTGE
jgi:hypothetical protein